MPSYSEYQQQLRAPVMISNNIQYGTQTFTASAQVLTSTGADFFKTLRRCAITGISAQVDTIPVSGTVKLVAMNGASVLGTLGIASSTAGQPISTAITEATLALGDTLSFNVIATGTASASQVNGSYTIWCELRELFS